jgi:hypothetical protein
MRVRSDRTGLTIRPLVLLVMISLAGSWTLGALPAQAASGDPDVVPVIECSFLDTGTGIYNTVWGYTNQTKGGKNDLSIPVGPTNAFDNPGQNSGQPTVFKAGTERNAFILSHRGSSTWTLTTYRVTAPGQACATNPVPIVSSSSSSIWAGLATLALFTVIGMGILFWRMRRGRRV